MFEVADEESVKDENSIISPELVPVPNRSSNASAVGMVNEVISTKSNRRIHRKRHSAVVNVDLSMVQKMPSENNTTEIQTERKSNKKIKKLQYDEEPSLPLTQTIKQSSIKKTQSAALNHPSSSNTHHRRTTSGKIETISNNHHHNAAIQ